MADSPRILVLALFVALLTGGLAPAPAGAKLEPKEWRAVKERADSTFGQAGQREAKAEIVAKILEDGLKRSWDLLVTCFVREAEAWVRVEKRVRDAEKEIYAIQLKPMAKRYPEEQKKLRTLQAQLADLEETATEQRGALQDITEAVVDGPEALAENLLKKVKRGADWPVRAAAIRVAAARYKDRDAFAHLQHMLEKDKDARVRMSGLEALRAVLQARETDGDGEGEEGEKENEEASDSLDALVIGRLADPDWGVQLFAIQIVDDLQLTRAVPHLINALGFSGPRVREAIGDSLRKTTGENFDPFADVWAKWWADNKDQFEEDVRIKAGKPKREQADVHFYGLPVKSDRVLFIIDTSKSMELPTKNENPAEKWKPASPTTGDGPAPPPPPEEILSGPKIVVAKHELKKALKKLPPTAKFNIIAFNSAVLVWKDGMMDATKKNKEDALQWVRALEPKGSTYIDGALRVAFRIAGLGSVDKAYPEINVDTIVLLSDGAPTDDGWPDAKLMEPSVILEHVREWNKFGRVVIHCIGIDIQEHIVFLQDLADQNGGEYVDR